VTTDTPTLIAHRGCPLRGPENTLAAFRAAADHADVIELDARRCGSGEVVVFHDDGLDRLLGVEGTVVETDLTELQSHTVLDSSETVPTLAEAFEAIPDHVAVNVELKGLDIAEDVASVVTEAANEVLISSFAPDALRGYASVADDPTALITAANWTSAVETAVELGCDAIHPQHELVSETRVETAHDHDLDVNCWTIRETGPVDGLREAGVDGLIVDDWALVEDA
jgi:glycerophosphoryl diester phosphodiesterase